MRKLTFFCLLVLLCSFLFSFQNSQTASTQESENETSDSLDLELTGTTGDTAIAMRYINTADSLLEKGKYKEALAFSKKGEQVYKKSMGEESLGLALAFHQIGVCYEKLSVLDSVEYYYQQSYDIRTKLLGMDHPSVGDIHHDYGVFYKNKGEIEKSYENLMKALEIQQKNEIDSVKLSNLFNDLGSTLMSKKEFADASMYFNKSLDIRLQYFGSTNEMTGQSYNNIGVVYYYRGLYKKAYLNFKKALDAKVAKLGSENPQIMGSLINLGSILALQEDFERANDYFQKALSIAQNSLGENHQLTIKLKSNIAAAFLDSKEYDKSIEYGEASLNALIKKNGKDHPDLINTYRNLGSGYSGIEDYDQAIAYFNEGIRVSELNHGKNNVGLVTTYAGLATVYEQKDKIDKAIKLYDKVIDLQRENFGDKNSPIAIHRYNQANLYFLEGELEQALKFNELAQKSLNYSNDKKLDEVLSLNYLSLILNQQSEILIKKHELTGSTEYLVQASEINQKAIQVLDQIKKNYVDPSSKSDIISSRYSIFENGISINSMLADHLEAPRYKKTAFSVFEKSKAIVLTEAVNDVRDHLSISQDLLDKEHDLKYRIAQNEKERFEKQVGIDELYKKDSISTFYSNLIFDDKKTLDSLQTIYEVKYPKYFQTTYIDSEITIDEIQNNLIQTNEALVEYFVGDSTIFTFVITKENYKVFETKIDFPLLNLVKEMRSGIYQPFLDKRINQVEKENLNKEYTTAAFQLYQKIIQPAEEVLEGTSKLIIIPDGVLGYIPFDALLTSPVEDVDNYRNYPYLLKKYQTSIAYSATLLKEMKDKKHKKNPSKNFLAVAPLFKSNDRDTLMLASRSIDVSENRNRLGALNYNIPEAKGIQEQIGGDLLIDTEATEEAFTNIAGDYRILHLSTHGKANDKVGDYSFLAFYELEDSLENEWLYNRELYELELNADMVVLSACETGIGELQRGEGIISLARGFSYAGAKSIVTSLWSVNDQQTPELMNGFYDYLKQGNDKDEALRNAKLDYLQNSSNPEPFFWAAFIPIGDMSPIDLDSGMPLWSWGLLGVLGIALLGFFFRKR